MSEFKGRITEISQIKVGKTKKDQDWASVDFEVTESEPNNPDYPQIALFSFFKTGEYFKYANEFNDFNKLGDEVIVDYNFKCNKYVKEGIDKKFYKVECWKLTKATVDLANGNDNSTIDGAVYEAKDSEPDDLPF
jgi:hypothetical protein